MGSRGCMRGFVDGHERLLLLQTSVILIKHGCNLAGQNKASYSSYSLFLFSVVLSKSRYTREDINLENLLEFIVKKYRRSICFSLFSIASMSYTSSMSAAIHDLE